MADDLTGYDDKFLLCRDPGVRHNWSVIGWYRNADGRLCRDMRCSRCTTVKTQDVGGYRKRNSYDYPDGYHLPGKYTYDDLLNEAASRTTVHASREAMQESKKRRK